MLFAFCFHSLFGGEWLKLPVLLDHYQEHREELREISFLDFLTQHYGQADHATADHQHEGKLPFKSGLAIGLVHALMADVPQDFVLPHWHIQLEIKALPFSTQSNYGRSLLSAIWQPPKQA